MRRWTRRPSDAAPSRTNLHPRTLDRRSQGTDTVLAAAGRGRKVSFVTFGFPIDIEGPRCRAEIRGAAKTAMASHRCAPEQETALLTYRGTVYPWHCDHMGHMNVMWYVGKFDEATWQFFNAIGLRRAWLVDARRGMAAVDQRITYAREVHAGATVSIQTAVLEIHRKCIVFSHEMTNDEDGSLAAHTTLVGVHIDTQARRSCELPDHVLAAARALITHAATAPPGQPLPPGAQARAAKPSAGRSA
jgi:acyl-CoA thioester hydrolase